MPDIRHYTRELERELVRMHKGTREKQKEKRQPTTLMREIAVRAFWDLVWLRKRKIILPDGTVAAQEAWPRKILMNYKGHTYIGPTPLLGEYSTPLSVQELLDSFKVQPDRRILKEQLTKVEWQIVKAIIEPEVA